LVEFLWQIFFIRFYTSYYFDVAYLKRVLFINRDGTVKIGNPCLDSSKVQAKILKHLRGRKITVFKMKPKKNTRSKKGHRQNLTRLLIQEIIN